MTNSKILPALKVLITELSKNGWNYVAAIGVFCYHVIFNKDLPCSCGDQHAECWLYMTLPAVLILVLILWRNENFQRVWKFTLANRKRSFCGVLCRHILEAVFIGLLWPVSVLLDGDWYVCCYNDEARKQASCRNKTEAGKITTELKNQSMVYGLPIFTGMIFLAALLLSLPWRKWSKWPVAAGEIILEEGENLVTEKLRDALKAELSETIDTSMKNDWTASWCVPEKMVMDVSCNPRSAGPQQNPGTSFEMSEGPRRPQGPRVTP